MKIGIITYHNAINYGAVLQVYGLKTALEKHGVEVAVIDYRAIPSDYGSFTFKKTKNVDEILKTATKYIYFKIFSQKNMINKRLKFEKFVRKYLNPTKHIETVKDFEKNNIYDVIVCGSDQIWNPEITSGFDPMMFGEFDAQQTQKYSYAASVGDVNIIKNTCPEGFFNLLNNFDGISVREKELADYISINYPTKPLVTLDPTLLLDKNDYDVLDEGKPNVSGKYLLVYQLARYPKMMELAKRISAERDLEIIEIINTPYITKKHKNMLYSASPNEFINLFKNADFVLTNSFHGTVFSVIFQKDFFTIVSRSRASRIINILETLNLRDRLLSENTEDYPANSIDYSNVEKLLEIERSKSNEFLRRITRVTSGKI